MEVEGSSPRDGANLFNTVNETAPLLPTEAAVPPVDEETEEHNEEVAEAATPPSGPENDDEEDDGKDPALPDDKADESALAAVAAAARVDKALAERGASSSNVTSFIVSEEPSDSKEPRVMTSPVAPSDAPNVVEPAPPGDAEPLLAGDGFCAAWLDAEAAPAKNGASSAPLRPPAPAGPVVEPHLEEPLAKPSHNAVCTLVGDVSSSGVITGRWGMTQDSHDAPDGSLTRVPEPSSPLGVGG